MRRPPTTAALRAAGMEITRDVGVNITAIGPSFASEKSFMAWIVSHAKANGWNAFHPLDSRGSEPGWPDLFLVRERAIALEVKTETGRLTDDQARWLLALRACGIEARVVRPADAEWIRGILEGKP